MTKDQMAAHDADVIYIVIRGHTLAYMFSPGSEAYVLEGKPQLGGHDPMNGSIAFDPKIDSDFHTATQKDFDFFRVSSKGHL